LEKWSKKYKSSIDCSHPRGFSQRAHCQGRKKHNEDAEAGTQPTLMDALRDFFPVAMQHLDLDHLPRITFVQDVTGHHAPTFGKFMNAENTIFVDIENRHPNDILRTLAHELVHYRQMMDHQLDDSSGETGSDEENQANAQAGVIMRNFNQQYPEYLELGPVILPAKKTHISESHDATPAQQWSSPEERCKKKISEASDADVERMSQQWVEGYGSEDIAYNALISIREEIVFVLPRYCETYRVACDMRKQMQAMGSEKFHAWIIVTFTQDLAAAGWPRPHSDTFTDLTKRLVFKPLRGGVNPLDTLTEQIEIGKDTPAQQWIRKIYDEFHEHPFNPRYRVMTWGSGDDQQLAIFELAPVFGKPTTVDIKWFQAYPQRQGIGTRAMQRLQQLALEHGITLTIYPWNRGEVSQSKLTKIYRGMGFKPSANRSKDMTWSPNQLKDNEGVMEGSDFFAGSKFADEDGNTFSVEKIIAFAKKNPKYFHKDFPLSKIKHDLSWWQGNKERMMNADTSFPLLVIQNDDGHLGVADGLNRMKKAVDVEKKTTIDVYLVPKKDIMKFSEKQGVMEGGAETSWSDGAEKITLQDILELTKHIQPINLPINDNLKSKLIHWDGNPEEIERINQVTVSNQFPILVMLDGQGQIDWILDGNHRLHKAIRSQAKTIPAKLIKPSDLSDKAKRIFHIKEQGLAEGSDQITELRDRMYQYIKSIVPNWPDYVVQDWLYKGSKTDTKDGIIEKISGAGLAPNSKWQLVPNMKFTMDMFDPITKQRLMGRAGGTSDLGMGIPKDKERHATQAALAQQQGGVRKEPVLLIKTAKGYELLEGWHRTIQHFVKYPNGYTGPAYVAVAQGQQGVAEGVPQPGKSSGKPISWIDPTKVVTKYLTLPEILKTVSGIPYYTDVVKDRDSKDFSWGVTKKVLEYARELIIRPDAYKNWPPIIVLDGKLQDGAHRISTIYLMQQRVQPNNPIWKTAKLKVEFGSANNVKQSVAESGADSNLSYQGNCTEDDVIEHIFGDVNNFANMVEEHGDEFTVGDLVVKYDPETDVHSFYYKKQSLSETFDQPYPLTWEHSEYGDVDALATLDDGTYLSVTFSEREDDHWRVEFYRNNSQQITGQGDAHRVFATVLAAIAEFVKKQQPRGLSFAAVKGDEDDDSIQDQLSRIKLYDRMVERYARSAGYGVTRVDKTHLVAYKLTRLKQELSEQQHQDYMAGHCHVMAIALKLLHPDWQIRAHIGWDDDEAEDHEYRVDHVYIVAPDGSAYDCRGRFDNEDQLVGPDTTGGIDTQYVDLEVTDIKQLISRGELKQFTKQDIVHATEFAKQNVNENFKDGRNPQDKGDSKRYGVPTRASVSTLRKVAKQGGRRGQLAHWMANMKAGRAKAKRK
jgi:GNAT superfamily N-acetyltransferase